MALISISSHYSPSFLSHSSPSFAHIREKEASSPLPSTTVSEKVKSFDTEKALAKLNEMEEKASFHTTPHILTLHEWRMIVMRWTMANSELSIASCNHNIMFRLWKESEVRREEACEEACAMQDAAIAAAEYSSDANDLDDKALEAERIAKNSTIIATKAKTIADESFASFQAAYEAATVADEKLAGIIEYL